MESKVGLKMDQYIFMGPNTLLDVMHCFYSNVTYLTFYLLIVIVSK